MDFFSNLPNWFGTKQSHNEQIFSSYYGNDDYRNQTQPNPNNRSNPNASFNNSYPSNNYNPQQQQTYFPPRKPYQPRPQPVYNPKQSQWQQMKDEFKSFRLAPTSIFNRGGKSTKKPPKRALKKKSKTKRRQNKK